jgi:L-ribulokinase
VRPPRVVFRPNRRHAAIYDRLYAEYSRLHDYFGRDAASPMRVLRELQKIK